MLPITTPIMRHYNSRDAALGLDNKATTTIELTDCPCETHTLPELVCTDPTPAIWVILVS